MSDLANWTSLGETKTPQLATPTSFCLLGPGLYVIRGRLKDSTPWAEVFIEVAILPTPPPDVVLAAPVVASSRCEVVLDAPSS